MTANGSVLHHPVHHLEKFKLEQSAHALERAHCGFDYHWDPTNITAITEAVTFRAARQTYAGLKRKGHQNTDLYARYLEGDPSKHLGLELDFDPPVDLDAEQHTFHRTMDRLSLHKLTGQPFIEVADFRTDQDYKYPRWNAKFSGYCWAATQSKFWTDGWGQDEGEALKVGSPCWRAAVGVKACATVSADRIRLAWETGLRPVLGGDPRVRRGCQGSDLSIRRRRGSRTCWRLCLMPWWGWTRRA